ncbi:tomoregulin-2 isoform X2 [Denticeps clupeoides]|uniref:tomoregulin-2 isoform X2 n=1 Tax=Denticeps clupeoides TaxID=299321 RepID=UPI0010A3A659|nr:tomoregulin-2-like isoform X2 [Denticeps clupeoides]
MSPPHSFPPQPLRLLLGSSMVVPPSPSAGSWTLVLVAGASSILWTGRATAPRNGPGFPPGSSWTRTSSRPSIVASLLVRDRQEPVVEGGVLSDMGSGSGDDAAGEGSAETGQRETSTCDICQFGAECDEDAEDVWCVCNIDCAHISFNPVCASDGRSYDNPCQVKEESCQKQERIEVKYLGHCQVEKTDGMGPDARGLYIPCPDRYKNYCIHGECEYPNSLQSPTCSCHSGFSGPQCDTKEYNVMYVVPGSGKLRYVLIASVIGALQVAIICLVVLCITRSTCRKRRRRGLALQPTTLNQWENGVKESPMATPSSPPRVRDPLDGQCLVTGGLGEGLEEAAPHVALHLWYTTPMKTGA